ncbi:hypothetical protein GCM10007968_25970 [Sporolactobacillus putidus]|uniref:Uncharacterized protein n=1 Tax=Sporolactobacillus putidus TaxID=492735 RepID=A0A917S7H7_9BACL|nr:hypothetical protein GCM10007968_25970 [Sporolactobacillus putidus]
MFIRLVILRHCGQYDYQTFQMCILQVLRAFAEHFYNEQDSCFIVLESVFDIFAKLALQYREEDI